MSPRPLSRKRLTLRQLTPPARLVRALQLQRRYMLELVQDRLPVQRRARQDLDAGLGRTELAVAQFQQTHALLVLRQRFLQAGVAVLQLADDLFQVLQGLLEWDRLLRRFAHSSHPIGSTGNEEGV